MDSYLEHFMWKCPQVPQDLTYDLSALVQVMAWCHQTSYYLSQCWPRSLSPSGVSRPEWVKPEETRGPFQKCLWALQTKEVFKFHICMKKIIFQCMAKIFYIFFQNKRVLLKFHTQYYTHTQYRAGVKYVLSNTNTNTNTFFSGVSNTNTNTNTPAKIWSNTNTNTNTAHQIQIQIQIHNEAETKLPPFYRWHIEIYCIVRRLFIHSNFTENCFQRSNLQ